MEVKEIPHERQIQEGKYHVDMSDDEQVKELKAKYELAPKTKGNALVERIEDSDLKSMLDRYAEDVNVDLTTVAQAFNVEYNTLHRCLSTEKWRDYFAVVKEKRGEKLVQLGFEVASTPFRKIQEGQEVSMVEVASAKLMSNYAFAYGGVLNRKLSQRGEQSDGGNGINITVNAGFQLKV